MGKFFVRRPIVAIVIAIVTANVGVVSMLGLPIEQYPNISPPMVQIRANYTGANALSVESSVATPLEQQVNGVDNMIYMKSTNSNDGSLALNVSFDIGTDADMNTVFAQNRVSAATAKLPEEVKRLGVTTQKSFAFPLMLITLTSKGDRYDQNFLGNYATINIKDLIARTPGVGRVDILGGAEYSMRIWVKPDRLAVLGLTIPEIMNAVREQNVIVPGGSLGAEPAPEGTEFTYTVRLPDRLQTEEEFGEIVVRTNTDGSQVKLKDVARVQLGVENYKAYTRFQEDTIKSKPSALLAVYQMPGTNAVETAEVIINTMEDLEKNFPEGMGYYVSLDTTQSIMAGINEIVETLIIALILVILVVFLFIQDWRATLIPTLAIPVSLVGAFIFFPLLGFTINVLSLLGLVLAIGIVVDDAIVVVEAVQVNMEKGMGPKEATDAAMKQVTAPVIATTLVLIAVFAPVSFMGGITGILYQQFAITIAVSVAFSSVNALTLSPALCSLLLKKDGGKYSGVLGKFFGRFNKAFDRSTDKYMSINNVFTRKITRGIIIIGILLIGTGVVAKLLPGGFLPEEDQGYLLVNVQLPPAASLQRTDAVMKDVEGVLRDVRSVQYSSVVSGFSLLSGSYATNTGFVFVALKDWGERDKTAGEIANELNGRLWRSIKNATAFSFGPPAIPGLGNGSGFSMMVQDKSGGTPEYLSEYTNKLIRAAMERPEIGAVFTPFQPVVPQRYLDLDREKALKVGVNLNDLYSTVGAFLGGAYINDFNRFGRLYKAYIQAENEYRQNEDQVSLFFVKNKNGDNVPLNTLVDIKPVSGPEFTIRYNLFRAAELTGQPAPGFSSAQAMKAMEEVASNVLPANMGYEWTNMSYQEKKAEGSAVVIFAFSLIFVFLILAAQYESWSLPFSILLGTPFALFGALLGLYVARMFSPSFENNIFAQISLVMLIAMAAKNAILIIEFANIKFNEGLSLMEAALESARLRFRPILMTVFSFILGIFPLVLASGAGAEARVVMGMALLWGITLATALGIFFYPMLFVFIGKIARYEQKRDKEILSQQNQNKS
jgi:HAE1 family hydrophobic/amphiphilic exporter-1